MPLQNFIRINIFCKSIVAVRVWPSPPPTAPPPPPELSKFYKLLWTSAKMTTKNFMNSSIIFRSSQQRCFVKKGVLEISQNSQESTCFRVSFLIKLQVPPVTLLKKRLWHSCLPVNLAKFLRTPFSQNTSRRLLLYILSRKC